MKMKFFRCRICGDPFMAEEMPSHCPFCGAHQEHIATAAEWVDENAALDGLSETSRRNLVEALQLEVDNKAFYLDASSKAGTIELAGIFKNLSKIEGEHASTFRKILRTDAPDPDPEKSVAADDDRRNLETARAREEYASAFYARAADEAGEERVKKVFGAISAIESDHIELETELLDRR